MLVKAPGDAPGFALAWRGTLPVLCVGPPLPAATEARRFGAIKHELLHLLFHHPLPAGQRPLPWLHHLAADLVVNQYLLPDELAEDALTLAPFAPLSLPPGRDAGFYYRLLLDAWRQAFSAGDFPAWRVLLDRCLQGAHPAIRRHAGWRNAVLADRSREAAIIQRVDQLLRQARQSTPAAVLARLAPALRARLDRSAPPPVLDWRRQLRLFAASSRRSRLRHTIRRPSKRYGTTPGLRLERRGRLLIAVDTSASVSPALLAAFFAEVHQLWRSGYELFVVECDLTIRRRYSYQGKKPLVTLGRGGTRFDAPVAWANAHYRPDGILYFTDGKGPPLQERPRCPLLWIVGNDDGRLRPVRGHHPLN